jgi:hypothetical protein
MKMSLYLFTILVLGVFKISSQNPDVAISYLTRIYQQKLANDYNKELSNSLKNFLEYTLINTAMYSATKLGTPRRSTFRSEYENLCSRKWGILKKSRCEKKIRLLKNVDFLVRQIPTTHTLYTPKSAVLSRIMVKTNSILKNINKEVLNN